MTPCVRLRTFLTDMLEWETTFDAQKRSHQKERPSDAASRTEMIRTHRDKLLEIFGENLSSVALESRAQPRLSTLGTSRPPEFAQQILEDTEAASGNTVYIETLNEKDVSPRRRYALVMENDEPRIDAVYTWRDSTRKWAKQESI